jgi:hypothetical protein
MVVSGFDTPFMDDQFDCLQGNLLSLSVRLNYTSSPDHVGDVERYIRTVKECMRSTYNSLGPIHTLPARGVIELAKREIF